MRTRQGKKTQEGEKVSLIPADDSLIAGNICLYSERIIYTSKENVLSANTRCSPLWHSTRTEARRERHFSPPNAHLKPCLYFYQTTSKLVYRGNKEFNSSHYVRTAGCFSCTKKLSTKKKKRRKNRAPGGNGKTEGERKRELSKFETLRCSVGVYLQLKGPVMWVQVPGETEAAIKAEKCPYNNTRWLSQEIRWQTLF